MFSSPPARSFKSTGITTVLAEWTMSHDISFRSKGIAGGHAYTVMGLAGGKGTKLPRLIKIRNPWGSSFEWSVRF